MAIPQGWLVCTVHIPKGKKIVHTYQVSTPSNNIATGSNICGFLLGVLLFVGFYWVFYYFVC